MRMKVIAAMAAAAILTACAIAPDRIAARTPDAGRYEGMTCAQLAAERTGVATSLASAEAAGRRTRVVDSVGVAVLFLPVVSLFGGNHERQIGALKGERGALDAQLAQNRCFATPQAADTPLATNPQAF